MKIFLSLVCVGMAFLLSHCGDWGCEPGDVHLYDNCVSICDEDGYWETACF